MIQVLKDNNIKSTPQREKIYNIINNQNKEITIKEIMNLSTIDKSTVYRILDLFIEKEIITTNVNHEGTIFYTINNHEHIHYLNCIKCHKRIKINFCPIDSVKEYLNKEDLLLVSHKIQLDVICKECQKNS